MVNHRNNPMSYAIMVTKYPTLDEQATGTSNVGMIYYDNLEQAKKSFNSMIKDFKQSDKNTLAIVRIIKAIHN